VRQFAPPDVVNVMEMTVPFQYRAGGYPLTPFDVFSDQSPLTEYERTLALADLSYCARHGRADILGAQMAVAKGTPDMHVVIADLHSNNPLRLMRSLFSNFQIAYNFSPSEHVDQKNRGWTALRLYCSEGLEWGEHAVVDMPSRENIVLVEAGNFLTIMGEYHKVAHAACAVRKGARLSLNVWVREFHAGRQTSFLGDWS